MGKQNSKVKKLAKNTFLTEQEVESWHQKFLEICPNGQLTEEGLLQIYKQKFSFGDPTNFAKLMFRLHDENKDGAIDFDEFIRGMAITYRGTLEEKLFWAFKLCDVDSDGYVTKEEVSSVFVAICQMIGQDLEIVQNWYERIERMFQKLDKNKDNKLSQDEFVQGCKLDLKIVQMLSLHNVLSSRELCV